MCFHKFEGGYGIMGDAYRCSKCRRWAYYESIRWLWLYKLLGRVSK